MDPLAFDPVPGTVEQIEPGVRRILAPNPSPMTFRGTNTYIIGTGQVAVIDPGPDRTDHMDAILNGLQDGETISHIFVTHSHIDHSPLARSLSDATGALIYAYGDSFAGRSLQMDELAKAGLTGGGEGVDSGFRPDMCLKDGQTISTNNWALTALWSPGHFSNHMCFVYEDTVFSGDLIMGWASTMVSPPDGDLSAFMASAALLANRSDRIYFPGHGAPIPNPKQRVEWLIKHRQNREAEILAQLKMKNSGIPDITKAIYKDVPPALLPAAERNVFAHLIDLTQRNRISAEPKLSLSAQFHLL